MLPGNKKFVSGDQIERPQGGSGGGGGKEASDSGEGEDAFSFALSEAEFLDILFDDLELPDLVKATLKDETASEFRRAGFSSDGSTPNLNVLRTMRTSMSRRLALRRPSRADLQKKEAELAELRENVGDSRRAEAAGRSLSRNREDEAASARDPLHRSDRRALTTGSSPSPCRAPRPSCSA